MTSKRVIPYKKGHLDFIDPLDCYGPQSVKEMEFRCDNPNTLAVTLVVNRRPISVVGCDLANSYVLNIWAYSGKEVKKYPLFYHKSLKYLIDGHVDVFGVKRVQSVVIKGNEAAIRQHLSLGFEIEAELKCTGTHGEDQILLRRLIDG